MRWVNFNHCFSIIAQPIFLKYGRNRQSFAYTEGAVEMVERVTELFKDTLELFRVWNRIGRPFTQVIDCAEKYERSSLKLKGNHL